MRPNTIILPKIQLKVNFLFMIGRALLNRKKRDRFVQQGLVSLTDGAKLDGQN